MVVLKVSRQPGGAVAIVDSDGDTHVARNPREAWAILRALTDEGQTRALVRQDATPEAPRVVRRRTSERRQAEPQVIREPAPETEPEPEGDIVTHLLARAGAGVLDGVKALGKTSDFRHGSRRWPG